MSRNKNVSKVPADPSSKLKLTLKKEGADSTKFLVVFLFLDIVLHVEHDVMNTGALTTVTATNTINVIEL
jgi:hypothetical protein